MCYKFKKEKSVDSKLARGCVSKLLLEGSIFCKNFNSLLVGLFTLMIARSNHLQVFTLKWFFSFDLGFLGLGLGFLCLWI